MADPSLILGNGNWAVKSDSLLGYALPQGKYTPREFTVTRATTATRVNSAGLVEVVPYNLVQYSEEFGNAAWTKLASSVTDNVTTAPDGTLTADKIIPTITLSAHLIRNGFALIGTVIGTSVITNSIYAKASEYNSIRVGTNAGASIGATFNLLTGVISNNTAISAFIDNVGNGWYRCTVTGIIGSVVDSFVIDNSGNNTFSGNDTNGLFIWGAQIVEGTEPLDYLPTTTRLNIPRVDYSTGSANLLLEPQRTNLAVYSEQFDNASWTKGGSTIIADSIVSPSGVQNADTFNEGTTTNVHSIINYFSISSGVNNTFSVYIKKGTSSYIRISIADNTLSTIWVCAQFNLDTLTFTSGVGSAGGTFISASIVSANNGWYRCILVGNIPITGVGMCIISSSNGVAITSADSRGRATYTGISNTFYLWGAQLEAGAYATSYIPTTSASVTRNADQVFKTGITSLIGQSEGTIYLEADIQKHNDSEFYVAISNGASLGEAIYLYQPSGGILQVLFRSGGVTPTISILNANWNIGYNKIAIAYNSTSGEVFMNGVSKGTVALSALPSCSQLTLGSRPDAPGSLVGSGGYKVATLFKTRLSNSELATLTTI